MRKGDLVRCINDRIDADKIAEISKDFENWIVKGEQYKVREVLNNDGIVTGILLEEVHNFPKYFKLIGRTQEPAFATWRFEKVVEAEVGDEVLEGVC